MLLFADRFVAGETKEEAVDRCAQFFREGFSYTLDFLGEHTRNEGAASAIAREYTELLNYLNAHSLPCFLSVKLTHLGLDISEELALNNMRRILAVAKAFNGFVRIDMEGSSYTERALAVYKNLHKEYGSHAGIVIQAYLYRSAEDIEEINLLAGRVRLCKGAYKEPPVIAFTKKQDVDDNFDRLCEMLMQHGHYPAIATHDELRIRNAISYARQYGKNQNDFEFQMLLGVRERLARDLLKSGYRVRLYMPYGKEWLRYFYRRVRERKENFVFVLRSIFSN